MKMMSMSMTLYRHYPKVDRSIVEVDFSNLQLLEDAFQAMLSYSTYTKQDKSKQRKRGITKDKTDEIIIGVGR